MTPQERDLIIALLNRLKQAAGQPKDPEAEALIRQAIAEQPDAPYLLVQTVLIQDMALADAQRRIAELERQLAEARSGAGQQSSSFLGGARGSVPSAGGPWGRPAAPPAAAPRGPWTQSGGQPTGQPADQPVSGQPMTGQPMTGQPMMQALGAPGATSGFLRSAATTAAGIAGGALLFQGIQSLFGHQFGGGGMLSGMPMQPGLSETVTNNYYGNDPSGDLGPDTRQADYSADPGGSNDPGWTQADNTPPDPGPDFASNDDVGYDPGFGGSDDNYDV
jgi:hypothetical protein